MRIASWSKTSASGDGLRRRMRTFNSARIIHEDVGQESVERRYYETRSWIEFVAGERRWWIRFLVCTLLNAHMLR